MKIFIGTSGIPVSKKRYYKEFNFVELDDTYKSIVKNKTLKKFKHFSGENFSFSLKAPIFLSDSYEIFSKFSSNVPILDKENLQQYGEFKNNDKNNELLEVFLKGVSVIDAKSIVFYTSNKFFPSPENIKNINGFFSRLEKKEILKNVDIFWHCLGFWDEDAILEALEETTVMPAYDPLMDELNIKTKTNYYIMRALGRYSRFYPDSALENLADMIYEQQKDSYVVFNGVNAFSDAMRFRNIINEDFNEK